MLRTVSKWRAAIAGGVVTGVAAYMAYKWLSGSSASSSSSPLASPPPPPPPAGKTETPFEAASRVARVKAGGLPDTQALRIYKYFKQATEGPCTTPKPGLLDFRKYAKWDAWSSLKDMSKEEAEEEYVKVVTELIPDWRELASSGVEESKELYSESGGGDGSRRAGRSMVPVVSTMLDAIEDPNAEAADSDALFDLVGSGDTAGVKIELAKPGADVNVRNCAGESALHLAADHGSVPMVGLLLEAGADVNAKEEDVGQTPLHYAVMAENADVAQLLISHGASMDGADSQGETPAHLCSEEFKAALKAL